MREKIIGSILTLGILWIIFGTQLASNVFMLTIEKTYFIPKESNLFIFEATKMNEGSSEWWLYGEDDRNYYGLNVDPNYFPRYFILKKGMEPILFDRFNFHTWFVE